MKEIWRDVSSFSGIYQVSNFGRVKSLRGWNGKRIVNRERILKPTIQHSKNGYKRYIVNLFNKTYKVHRLVAEAFIPKINGKNFVNHIDFNPLNNTVLNLEWCTQKENVAWNILHKANKNYSYVDKEKVADLYKKGATASEIAKCLNITKAIVYNITSRRNINRKEFLRKSKYISVEKLKELFLQGKTNKEISKEYNIPSSYIARRKYQIKKGEI